MEKKQDEVELSKNQRKKKAQEGLTKAKKLAALSEKQIQSLEYPEEVKSELLKIHKIKSKPARLRHTKYIAKLLRALDDR